MRKEGFYVSRLREMYENEIMNRPPRKKQRRKTSDIITRLGSPGQKRTFSLHFLFVILLYIENAKNLSSALPIFLIFW